MIHFINLLTLISENCQYLEFDQAILFINQTNVPISQLTIIRKASEPRYWRIDIILHKFHLHAFNRWELFLSLIHILLISHLTSVLNPLVSDSKEKNKGHLFKARDTIKCSLSLKIIMYMKHSILSLLIMCTVCSLPFIFLSSLWMQILFTVEFHSRIKAFCWNCITDFPTLFIGTPMVNTQGTHNICTFELLGHKYTSLNRYF